jgi:hypothetical protein
VDDGVHPPDGDLLAAGDEASPWSTWVNLERGRHLRLFRWAGAVAGAAAVAALVGVVVVDLRGNPGAARSAEPAATRRVVPGDGETSFTWIRTLAASQVPLTDYVRSTSSHGACVVVAPGHLPDPAIKSAVRAAMPGFVIHDLARTLDQDTGLCSVQLRATNRSAPRTTLVLSVSSPSVAGPRLAQPKLGTGSQVDGGIVTEYASALTVSGWTVVVGATGPLGAQPPSNDLLALAQDPKLTW